MFRSILIIFRELMNTSKVYRKIDILSTLKSVHKMFVKFYKHFMHSY